MARHIYQIKITLDGVEPPVWRRVLVPGGYTLDRLHRAIQCAMGWHDCHLHSFEVDGEQYGDPDPGGELAVHDELDFRLDAVAGKGTRLRYTYDFGDWWEHEVMVEDVSLADPDARYPTCLDGGRACPPEDVGGPDGYTGFLAAIADPGHAEHAVMVDWIGRPIDTEEFDPHRVSTLLRRMV